MAGSKGAPARKRAGATRLLGGGERGNRRALAIELSQTMLLGRDLVVSGADSSTMDDRKLEDTFQKNAKTQVSGLQTCVRMVRRQGLEPRTR
jgi:hypothetical protein